MARTSVAGRFLWHELLTADPSRAEDFYSKLLGWRAQHWEGSDPPYTIWAVDDHPIAGLMELPEDARAGGDPSHWLPYLGSDDVDTSVARAVELGAETMVEPRDIPGAGRFAVLCDPQGALFALYTPAPEASEPPDGAGPGRFSWHDLATTDHGAALAFYRELTGWEETGSHDMGEMGIYRVYGTGGRHLGGMYDVNPEEGTPPAWLPYVSVADAAASAAKVKELGGTVLYGPREVPGGDLIVQCADPEGAFFALHEVRR